MANKKGNTLNLEKETGSYFKEREYGQNAHEHAITSTLPKW